MMSLTRTRLVTATLLPIVIAALGVWLLVGCVYVPTFGKVVEGKDVSPSVGEAKSSRAIRVGHATRADVVRLLGPPAQKTWNNRAIAYRWTVMNGLIIWPLCFSATPEKETRALVLTFDENDTLVSYQVSRNPEAFLSGSGAAPEPILPLEFYGPPDRPTTKRAVGPGPRREAEPPGEPR